ncbi:MAG: hypothetical protein K9M80_01845 [Candidatus Marinimicrobia bacterium]|nr:hypothetical protein [Candidatus Neomarinimicrobiota bacterium]
MKFVDTYRLSPVIEMNDLPHEADLYHHTWDEIPSPNTEHKLFQEYYRDNNIVIDRSWWKKQYLRCQNGYTIPNAIKPGGDYFVDNWDVIWLNDGKDAYLPEYNVTFKNRSLTIPGRMYFYLNFWPIVRKVKGEKRKDFLRPKFLDIDLGFFLRILLQIQKNKNNLEYKGRQLGFSEKGSGGILGFNYSFIPNTQNIVVSQEDTDQESTFEKTVNGLEFLRNTQFFKLAKPYRPTSHYLKSKYTGSWIRGITTAGKDQALSRYTPYWVLYEEIGKWKSGHVQSVSTFVESSQKAEEGGDMERTGFGTYIGTAGDMDLGAADIEDMHYNPDDMDLLSFRNKFSSVKNRNQFVSNFVSADYFKSVDKDGNSNAKKGYEIVEKNIADIKDPKKRYIKRTQNPHYAEDGFMAGEDGYFGPDKIIKLNNKATEFRKGNVQDITRTGILVPKNPKRWRDGMIFQDDPKGWLHIAEEPKVDQYGDVYRNLYFPGTDSYDQDEAYTSTSKGAFVVRKGFLAGDPLFNSNVAYILNRPKKQHGGAKEFYRQTLWACIYFGFARNNIEYSNLRIFDFYDQHNFNDLLMLRPKFALANKIDISKSQSSNTYGTDKALKPYILAILADDIDDTYIENIQFRIEAAKFSKFKYYPGEKNKALNCDYTIAAAEAALNHKENIKRTAYSRSEQEKKNTQKSSYYVTIENKLVKKYA